MDRAGGDDPSIAGVVWVHRALVTLGRMGTTITYEQLAHALELRGAGRIGRVGALLESFLHRDLADGRPPAAFVVVSRRTGLPAAPLLAEARRLGLDRAGESDGRFVSRVRADLAAPPDQRR